MACGERFTRFLLPGGCFLATKDDVIGLSVFTYLRYILYVVNFAEIGVVTCFPCLSLQSVVSALLLYHLDISISCLVQVYFLVLKAVRRFMCGHSGEEIEPF